MDMIKLFTLTLAVSLSTDNSAMLETQIDIRPDTRPIVNYIHMQLIDRLSAMPVESVVASINRYLEGKNISETDQTLVKNMLIDKLSGLVFTRDSASKMLPSGIYLEQINKLHFDGTSSCEDIEHDACLDRSQTTIIRQKPSSPWHNFSWQELIARYIMISKAFQSHAPYPK